jgi:sodium/bile acid cotransporter 7
LKIFDQSVILLIIYCSFSESFYEGVFKNFDALYLLEILLMATALLFVVYGIITIITKALHFERKDQITAKFCGSKKSLVHGTVMSKVLFANAASAGLILLPLMIYHSLQLLIISIIAGKIQRVSSKSVPI